MADPSSTVETANRELRIVREFAAPRALVFEAWTNPDLMLRWMCPDDFTVVSAEVDPVPGGTWRSHIRSPDGADIWHSGTYREFQPPSRLVFTHVWAGAHPFPGIETLVTIDLVERGNGTEMTFIQATFADQADCDDHAGGWMQAFDQLERAVGS